MAQFVNIYDVDLMKPSAPRQLRQMVCEGDAKGNRVGANVYSDGSPVSLGGQCVGKVVRADGTTVQLTGTVSGNQAYVVLDQASCAIEGPVQVAVCWVSGTNITTLVVAYGAVINTQTGTAIQPSTPIPDLTQLLAEIDNMRTATAAANAAAERALANFAQAFSTSTAYTAGQYVTYTDGKLYVFTADHAAGAWNSSQVAAVTVGRELEPIIPELKDVYETVYGEPNFTPGYRLDRTDGSLIRDADYCVSPFIPVTGGTQYGFYYGVPSNSIYLLAYDSGKNVLEYYGTASGSEWRNISSLNANAAYVRFTFDTGYNGKLVKGSTVLWQTSRTDGLADEVAGIHVNMDAVGEVAPVEDVITPEITSVTYGYVAINGRVEPEPSSNAYYCNKIPVIEGDVLAQTNGDQMRFVTAYSGDTAVSASGAASVVSYTVPSGIDGVIISVSGFNADSQAAAEAAFGRIRIARTKTQYTIYTDPTLTSSYIPAQAKAAGDRLTALEGKIGTSKVQSYEWRGNLAANQTLDTGIGFAPKLGFSCGLFGELSGAFSGLTLQLDAYSPNQIIIAYDSTAQTDKVSVTFKSRFIGDTTRHIDMDISGTFAIMVAVDNPDTANVTIYSNGVKNTVNANFAVTAYETFKIVNGNNALTNAIFTMGCGTINHPIWLFGDSYFGMRTNDLARWPHYAYENGYVKNAMFCGSTGSGHTELNLWYDSLIELGHPRTVINCMGMNYPTDSGSAPAAAWLADVQKLTTEAQTRGFELILATIPSVPGKSHEQKNAHVRNSGLRYIDFAKAVGAQPDGTWTEGMLATDGVHPTETGAIALYAMAISSVPELTYDYM